ncbi:SH3 domain-containing protein [Archangium minus]
MSQRCLLLAMLVLLCQLTPAFAAEPPKTEKQRITAASGVKMRATPRPDGQEVTRLFIGTELRELERSERQETVGSKKDYWYRVATPEGQEGWVFGAFVLPFEPERRVQTVLEIAGQRLADQKAPFVDRADLANFLKGAAEKAPDKASAARLELARWRAVRWALGALATEEVPKKAYEPWVKRQGEGLVYNELGAEWLVDSKGLWKLEEKYRGLPEAEAFAWEAATTPLLGECEGYTPCYLAAANATEGEYLRRYPSGPQAGKALAMLEETLGTDGFELDQDGRAELRKELDKLEATLGKVEPAKKKKVMEKLQALRKAAGR